MYTIDLHLKKESVQSAIYNLHEAIKLARRTKERVICLIVGYGSTGGTHKIKSSILIELDDMKSKNQIREYIIGSDIDIFNINYQNFKNKNLLDKKLFTQKNPGQIIVIV